MTEQTLSSSSSSACEPAASSSLAFSAAERAAVYRAIHERRDMRHFCGGTVQDDVLLRLLRAAHHAPSVGMMQPWRFIRVKSRELRLGIHALIEQERVRTAEALGERQQEFMKLKVEGVLDAAEVLVIAMPPGREAHVFGRRTLPEMDIASASCAVQNLWLAARAEGLGMGWVSIFDPVALAQLLRMPQGAHALGVLCLGPVNAFYSEPMLQQEKWTRRAPLEDMLMEDFWTSDAT
ncbi:5,6-dimethylbenzimidazole synthase [Diaphorobacter aerolatus]|uniref:5,6-dimethylbenzimidazole synthase n=1 Tax=Diaphorobacter aerolatus TaxID=1288495 RepID=A0A7H0GMQ7_9BURK|nr:5,6-dimethylbenzimidazole synthase [Diaphorobacter aerolatus]QNP49573.1 5,6-dimethylbenzimidazole synthase [Diaphorobacter aerolatus]